MAQTVKRLEVIVSSQALELVLDQFNKLDISGYSVIQDVVGQGAHGRVSDDLNFASTSLSNVYVLSFCTPEKTAQLTEKLQPILERVGGICCVSDALRFT